MGAVNIHIPSGPPEVEVDPGLRRELTVFDVSHEPLREGLALAGVPNAAIDTLNVHFRQPPTWMDSNCVYDFDTHTLSVDVRRGNLLALDAEESPWTILEPSPERSINHAIAYQAMRIADYTLRHPDTLVEARNEVGSYSRKAGVLGAAATAGVFTGMQVAESLHIPAWAGGLAGGILAATLDTSMVIIMNQFGAKRRANIVIDKAEVELEKRALDFANSEEAFNLFRRVVQIELVK